MSTQIDDDELTKLAQKFDLPDHADPADIPDGIVSAMVYIAQNTGLLGDYNQGRVFLGEGGQIIQLYGRSRYLSSHDDLLQWVQMENDDIMFGVVGTRKSPADGVDDFRPYVEIHTIDRWGYEPISEDVQEAIDILHDDDPKSREGRAARLLRAALTERGYDE